MMNILDQWILTTGTYVPVEQLVSREKQIELEDVARNMNGQRIALLVWDLVHAPKDPNATAEEANTRAAWIEILKIELSSRD